MNTCGRATCAVDDGVKAIRRSTRRFLSAVLGMTAVLLLTSAAASLAQPAARDAERERRIEQQLRLISPEAVPAFRAATAALDRTDFVEAARLSWMCAEDDPADQQTETVAMQPNFSGRSYVSCSYLVPWEIWPAADGHNDPGGRMKPRITVLTIAVDDLERALDFYANGLGLPTRGIVGREFEHGAVAFFDLERGLKLAIWPREDLAHDSGLPRTPPSVTEFSIGHTVRTEQEVDAVMRQAKRAGATIVKPARKTFWGGYAGYFTDPDGHLWEVAFNPSLLPDE